MKAFHGDAKFLKTDPARTLDYSVTCALCSSPFRIPNIQMGHELKVIKIRLIAAMCPLYDNLHQAFVWATESQGNAAHKAAQQIEVAVHVHWHL